MLGINLYRLQTPTLGITTDNGKRITVTMPAEALIEVVSEVSADGTVDVLWNARCVSMFAIDLRQRAQFVAAVAR
jgi:hypothetical protein